MTIRIAVAGLGKIARDQHLPAIRANTDFALAATVDPVAAPEDGTPHFASLDLLLASGTPVDAIAVCTPPQHRHAIAAQALKAGKQVLVEKPPCATLSEAEALARLAAEHGVTLYTAWHSRHAAGVEPARTWLAGKVLQSVEIVWKEDVRVWHPGQPWIFATGGFGVFDPAINALSIASHILPRTLLVEAAELAVPVNCAAPIAGSITMRDTGGVPVRMDMDFLQEGPQTWDVRIMTDEGELLLSEGGRVLATPDGRIEGEDREYRSVYHDFAAAIAAGRSAADFTPLRLVADAYLRAAFSPAPAFHDPVSSGPGATDTR